VDVTEATTRGAVPKRVEKQEKDIQRDSYIR